MLSDEEKLKADGKKLGEWMTEEKEIETHTLKDGKIVKGTKIIQEKVMYVKPQTNKVMCAPGKHDWYSLDPNKGIFACRKCKFQRRVYPTTYTFYEDESGGHLKRKDSGILL